MKTILIFCAIVVLSSPCPGQKKKTTSGDMRYHDIRFREITFMVDKKNHDTILASGILNGVATIREVPCQGEITLVKGTELKKFTLAAEHEFGGLIFPENTTIGMNIDLRCQSDINSLEYYFLIRGAGQRFLNRCTFTSSHIIINGIACDGHKGVFFTPGWDLIGCILSEPDTIAGNLLQKDSFIRFDKNGTISCFCPDDPVIQGYHCSGTDYTHWLHMGGGGIFLYPSGRLKYFQPVNDTIIQGVHCKPSSVRGGIKLFESGRLKACTSAKDQTIGNLVCRKNYTLEFEESGEIRYAEKEKIFD
jgi:hypothetical protein